MRTLIFLALAAAFLLTPASAMAFCVCFPCDDCELQNRGQLNIVVMDRDEGEVVLIPNIRFAGFSEDFALVVPTPSVPDLAPFEREVWDEVFELTSPVRRQNFVEERSFGCGDSASDVAFGPPQDGGFESDDASGRGDGVTVIGEQSVSGFIATILSSTSAEALSTWLDDNGYAFTIDDAEKFAPYIEKEWVFTAMKPDPNSPMDMPRGGWDSNVDPVVFTYQATDFEVPLPLLSIRRSFELPMAFFVIDRERADLEGFMTAYSNQISSSELKAIRDLYPTFGGLLETGTTVTRLDKVFGPEDAMDKTIKLRQASSEEEFRRVTGALNSFPGALILLTLVVGTGQRALNHFFSKEGEQNG